ncbi:MAG: GH32 C-terminal domain-containing protein, partial [Abditibacteriaceae bacterium]
CRTPVREIALLHEADRSWEKVLLSPDSNLPLDIDCDLLHFIFDIDIMDAREICLNLRGITINYSVKDAQISIGETVLDLPLRNNCIQGEILLDRTSLELYADNGRASIAMCFIPDANKRDVSVCATGGAANINTLHVLSLHSSWE